MGQLNHESEERQDEPNGQEQKKKPMPLRPTVEKSQDTEPPGWVTIECFETLYKCLIVLCITAAILQLIIGGQEIRKTELNNRNQVFIDSLQNAWYNERHPLEPLR